MRAIVITSGYTDIVDVIQAVLTNPDSEVASHIKIGSVTVCVDVDNTFMEYLYTLPKLLDNCARGWVNAILYSGTFASQQSAELERLQKLIRAVNSDVSFLLASNGDVTRSPDLDVILSESAFDRDALLRARYLSCPGWWMGSFECGSSSPQISERLLETSQPLDRNKTLNKLKALKRSHSSAPYHGNVYEVRGKMTFTGSPQQFELRYVVLSGALTITPAELEPVPPTGMKNGLSHACRIVFTGCQLNEAELKNWLRSCARPKMEKKSTKDLRDLTKPEISRIHKLHHLESLPEGWFYNGNHFVSLDGSKSDTHPDLDKFLGTYVDQLNLEICEHNRHVELQDYHDLFE